MKQLIKYTLIIWILSVFVLFSQIDSTSHLMKTIEKNLLNEVVVEAESSNVVSQRDYLILKRRVLKVYPYVDSIRHVIQTAEVELQYFSKKRLSRKYTRKLQKKIVSHFRKDIADLTRKEGVILSKLIYREFGVTAYDLILNYRNGFHAFFWQRLAKMYDGDLKVIFDEKNNQEDLLINLIIDKYIRS